MLDRYFQKQVHLAGIDANFICPDDCDAPGCWMEDIIVEVTLFDLIRLSPDLDISVSGFFDDICRIGLQTCETNPRYMRLLIKLNKPCCFFKDKRCRVQRSKPLNCILFPEYHQIAGLLPELAGRPVYINFPCLKHEVDISDPRKQALKKLREMSRKEEALSCYFLFGTPSFILDAKPMTRQLKKEKPKKKFFLMPEYDKLLGLMLEPIGFLDTVMRKVSGLDTEEGIARLFEKLEDNELMGSLVEQMSNPETVHIIKSGKIKQAKRNLQRPDIIFM
ncbi:hypothetical protein ACFL0O_10735 [Thermodesulfobacteriota bacterium]